MVFSVVCSGYCKLIITFCLRMFYYVLHWKCVLYLPAISLVFAMEWRKMGNCTFWSIEGSIAGLVAVWSSIVLQRHKMDNNNKTSKFNRRWILPLLAHFCLELNMVIHRFNTMVCWITFTSKIMDPFRPSSSCCWHT